MLPISPFLDAHMSLTPLHYAAWGGQLECTNMVLKSCKPYAANPPTPKAGGASPPLADDDDTLTESPLLLAARGTAGAAPVVQLLAAEGFTDHRALGHAATHTVRIGLLEAALLRHSEFMSLCATPRHAAPRRMGSEALDDPSTRLADRPTARCLLPPALPAPGLLLLTRSRPHAPHAPLCRRVHDPFAQLARAVQKFPKPLGAALSNLLGWFSCSLYRDGSTVQQRAALLPLPPSLCVSLCVSSLRLLSASPSLSLALDFSR